MFWNPGSPEVQVMGVAGLRRELRLPTELALDKCFSNFTVH